MIYNNIEFFINRQNYMTILSERPFLRVSRLYITLNFLNKD